VAFDRGCLNPRCQWEARGNLHFLYRLHVAGTQQVLGQVPDGGAVEDIGEDRDVAQFVAVAVLPVPSGIRPGLAHFAD